MAGILLTGFEPFGGATVNASWQAVSRVQELWNGPEELVARQLPVVFGSAGRLLTEVIDVHGPRLVVSVGEAGGRTEVTPERIAVNIADARIPDNSGASPREVPVLADGQPSYTSGLPLDDCVAALTDAGVPAHVSDSAGSYVCNAVFYSLMHDAASRPGIRAGFVHVPAVRGGTGELGIDLIAHGLVALLRAVVPQAQAA